uniref:Apple domain-containing protein n=1 Tax=Plectus sambesii TaxID=2011161 RepID=A0A914UX10_9BILA
MFRLSLLTAALLCSAFGQPWAPYRRSHFARTTPRRVQQQPAFDSTAATAADLRRAPTTANLPTPAPALGDPLHQPLAIAASPLHASAPHLTECFTFTQNCVILDATPYERRVNFDERKCAEMCMRSQGPSAQGYECRSLTFDKERGMCDLFAHAGNEFPGRFQAYDGVDYYEMLPNCPHRSRALNAPRLENVEPLSPFALAEKSTTSAPLPTTDAIVFTTAQPAATENLSTATSNGSCPLRTTPLLQRSDGYDILAEGETFFDFREEECVVACLTDGASINAPNKCLSFIYNTFTLDCVIYGDRSQPLGGAGEMRDNVETIFYEKMCIPDELTVLCPASAVIERFPNMAVLNHLSTTSKEPDLRQQLNPNGQGQLKQVTSTVDGYQQCVEQCLGAVKNLDFTCRSGQFFPTSRDNCVLNAVDHLQQPNLFFEQEEKGVQYFSLSVCTAPPQTDSLSNILTDTQLAADINGNSTAGQPPAEVVEDGSLTADNFSPTAVSTHSPKVDLMRKRLERLREYRQRQLTELSTLSNAKSPDVAHPLTTDSTYPDVNTFDTPNADYYEYSDQQQASPSASALQQQQSASTPSLFDLKFNVQRRTPNRASGNT